MLNAPGETTACNQRTAGNLDAADSASKAQKKRAEIDKYEKDVLAKLYKEAPSAKSVVGSSYGYAVFHSTQTALLISGGGGQGVAIERKTGKRTYMKMASAGAAAASSGTNKGSSFVDGMAIYQMTDKGLIAQASLKGTKYWQDDDLNKTEKVAAKEKK